MALSQPTLTIIDTFINTAITQLPYTSALYIERLLMTDRPSAPTRSQSIKLPSMAWQPAKPSTKAYAKGRPSKYAQPATQTKLKSSFLLKSSWLSRLSISVLLGLSLVACQPPAEQASNEAAADPAQANDDKVVITADTVTLTTNHILNIKSKRYQPSLGLKGTMFAINTITLASPTNASVQEVLVNEDQQVKKDTPLFVLKVLANTEDGADALATDNAKADGSETANSATDAATDHVTKDAQAEQSNNTAAAAKTTRSTPPANEQTAELAQNTTNNPTAPASTAPTTPPATVYKVGQLLTFKAPFFGSIEQLNLKVGERVTAQQPLLKLSNPHDLQFIATLPISAKSQLSIGQNVTFSVTELPNTFTGQISKLVPSSNPQHLLVHVHITQHDEIHNQLKPNMTVLGRVDYGQIEVGTIVPKSGIHNADLTSLLTPPYRAINPIKAEVWIIGQDQRLSRQQIQVIEYDPETQQYLVAGINNDSLICLAPLPADSEGKKVVVS